VPAGTRSRGALLPRHQPHLRACQGTNPAAAQYETTVCTGATDANLGICSDGDDRADTPNFDDRKFGSEGTALCVALNVVGTSLTVCGEEGGESLSGTRYTRENAPVAPTPQRRPGLAGLDTNPITLLRATSRVDYEAVDGNGVRRFFAPGDSLWNDAAFGNRLFTGGATSSSIITYQCDQFAQPTGQPFNPGGGTCSTSPFGACTFNTDCPNVGDVCTGLQYCYSSGIAVDNPGFIWTSTFTPDPNAACPPNCGTTYDFNTYEQEEIERVGAIDDNVGTQLALNSLGAPQADVGDLVSQLRVVSFTWIGDTDQRCFVTGEAGAPAGEVGKCSDHPLRHRCGVHRDMRRRLPVRRDLRALQHQHEPGGALHLGTDELPDERRLCGGNLQLRAPECGEQAQPAR
jgi:hypothetical protein